METQKIVNLLNDSDYESSKFATRKWYIINDQNKGQYGRGNKNDSTIKFETKVIKPNLCDYSDAYFLVTGVGGDQNTDIAFKDCSLFTRCVTHLNDEHVEAAENLDIVMNMCNLIEYTENYADSSGSLWQYKRDEQNMNNGNIADVTTNDSSSFKYKSNLLKGLTSKEVAANTDPNIAAAHRLFINAKIAVPVKYISPFIRTLEMPLVNCKIHFELNWTKNSIMSTVAGASAFQITSPKLYVPIVTLSTKDNVNLAKQ